MSARKFDGAGIVKGADMKVNTREAVMVYLLGIAMVALLLYFANCSSVPEWKQGMAGLMAFILTVILAGFGAACLLLLGER